MSRSSYGPYLTGLDGPLGVAIEPPLKFVNRDEPELPPPYEAEVGLDVSLEAVE